jgi:uncharacterized protein YkwD
MRLVLSRRELLAGTLAIFATDVLADGMKAEAFSATAALAAINQVRGSRGREPLLENATLRRIAEAQAWHLVRFGSMSHSPDGQHLLGRAGRAGYVGLVAENLADGYVTFEEAITAWLASPNHRTTLLGHRYKHFGAAVAVAPDAVIGLTGTYWVTEFGV